MTTHFVYTTFFSIHISKIFL